MEWRPPLCCNGGLEAADARKFSRPRLFERLNVSGQVEAAARLSRAAPFRLARA
jgi:hypothetical protein